MKMIVMEDVMWTSSRAKDSPFVIFKYKVRIYGTTCVKLIILTIETNKQ